MATPSLTGGVLERNKPIVYKAHVCWRFEGVLNSGSSITTPIFDVIGDGNPLTQVEIGAVTVVRVPSRVFVLNVLASSAPGGRINVFSIADGGGQDAAANLWCPFRSGSGNNLYRYEMVGRRCQFRLQNTPLGVTAAAAQTYHFEIVNEV